MEREGDVWKTEIWNYFRSIENILKTALTSIKRDRTRNNLPFDDLFMDFILKTASAR